MLWNVAVHPHEGQNFIHQPPPQGSSLRAPAYYPKKEILYLFLVHLKMLSADHADLAAVWWAQG